jgi:hypothetical protein
MTDYRRSFGVEGSFCFTVNLAERRLHLLTQHIEALRGAFRETRRRLRSRSMRWWCCRIISTRSRHCPKAMLISPRAGG